VIFVGDEAQEFTGKHYVKKNNNNMKIIFTSVKNNPEIYGYKPGENISGIINNNYLNTLNKTLQDIKINNKNVKKISLLADFSSMSQSIQQQAIDYKWADVELADVVVVDNFVEWQKAIKHLSKTSDLIFLTSTRSLALTNKNHNLENIEFADGLKVLRWAVEQSKTPLIVMTPQLVKHGADFGLKSSSYLEGIKAGSMALGFIKVKRQKKDFKNTVTYVDVFSFYINQARCIKSNITYPNVYKSLATAIDGYFEK
jgi:ABC-type uncharacterized transport system substrate-binding protein